MATMKNILRCLGCFRGGSSRQSEEDGIDNDHPFGYNEFYNYLARHELPFPEVRVPPDSSGTIRISDHPIHSGSRYAWQDILNRTNNRAAEYYLGRGGFGPVYRCDLTDQEVGAVKFLDPETQKSNSEFIAEITTLHRARHPNVIRLLGKSFGRNKVALIYEFMPNGSVDHHLLGNSKPGLGLPQDNRVLDWETRVRIALGVAEALVYLHTELKVIHRDIKVQNVLLDQNFEPKLTDFGLAVTFSETAGGSEINRSYQPIMGTRGCTAPDTLRWGTISTKSDVYAYGVFLFQLFTGKMAYDPDEPPEKRCLPDLLRPFWDTGEDEANLIDAGLGDQFSVNGLRTIFKVARSCTQPVPVERPDMGYVRTELRKAAAE